jgi:hypothetical protein
VRVSHLCDERQCGELRAAGLADEVHAGGIAAVLLRMVQHPPDPSVAVAQHVQHRALWQAAEFSTLLSNNSSEKHRNF